MATQIVPSVGQGCCFTAQGPGLSPGYSAIDVRRAALEGAQEGVVAVTSTEAGGWQVTQKGSGANMSVDIAANVACARVQGDTVTQQGLYTVAPHSAVINETITTADATNPRIDQVILEVLDNVHDASGSSLARTRVVAGSPTGGATLDNRSGAAALPSNAVRLADVLVGAGVTTIPNNKIRDRRPWARGAYKLIANTSAYTRTSSTLGALDTTNIYPRLECSGAPVRVTLSLTWRVNATSKYGEFGLWYDGAALTTVVYDNSAATSLAQTLCAIWDITPVAGSHQIGPAFASPDNTSTVTVDAGSGTGFTVEELPRQNLANNTVTSG